MGIIWIILPIFKIKRIKTGEAKMKKKAISSVFFVLMILLGLFPDLTQGQPNAARPEEKRLVLALLPRFPCEKGLRLAESLQLWDSASRIYLRLQELLPQLQEKFQKSIDKYREQISRLGGNVVAEKVVRSYSPSQWHAVYDIKTQ
jgi:hypothetical protein